MNDKRTKAELIIALEKSEKIIEQYEEMVALLYQIKNQYEGQFEGLNRYIDYLFTKYMPNVATIEVLGTRFTIEIAEHGLSYLDIISVDEIEH